MMPFITAGSFGEHMKVALVTLAVTGLVVMLHYEGLRLMARWRGGWIRDTGEHRRGFLGLMFLLLALHVTEIWLYGFCYYWLEHQPDMGYVHGEHGIHTVFDAIYFSATTYSTLGFGDLSPVGAIRMLCGMEALTGILLITWSASFTYLEMSRIWGGVHGNAGAGDVTAD